MVGTIDDVVRWWAVERPDVTACEVDGETISYAELDSWASRVAHLLLTQGVRPGDRVCIFAANSTEWCVLVVAILRVGAIVSGLNSRMKPSEIEYLVKDYGPRVLFVDDEGAGRLGDAALGDDGPTVISTRAVRELQTGEAVDTRVELDRKAPIVIVTTSGSTARPKGVVFSHETMIDYTAAQGFEDPVITDLRRVLVVGPMSTGAGFFLLCQSLIHGGSAYFITKFEPEAALKVLAKRRINVFSAATIFFERMAACPDFQTADLSALHAAATGGAPVTGVLLEIWRQKGVILRQLYGLTECGGNATINSRHYAISHPDRCGRGGALGELGIIDENGKLLPPGQQGQIVVRGPGNMLCYWNNPKATAEVYVDGWLRTGDIGVIDELGLLKFVDRLKDIIISGGLNISAAEIERVILEIPGVEDVAVIAAPDEKFGETPMAVVYRRGGLDAKAIAAHCETHLSGYKAPRYVIIADEPLPRLATGKVSKPILRARYANPESLPERVR